MTAHREDAVLTEKRFRRVPRPSTDRAGPERDSGSAVRLGEPRDRDAVDVLQGEAAQRVEQPGEVAGGGSEGVGGVQGGEEVFIEVAGVAGEMTFQEDGETLRVRIGTETVTQAAAGAGEDGGGELGGFFFGEDGGGRASATAAGIRTGERHAHRPLVADVGRRCNVAVDADLGTAEKVPGRRA